MAKQENASDSEDVSFSDLQRALRLAAKRLSNAQVLELADALHEELRKRRGRPWREPTFIGAPQDRSASDAQADVSGSHPRH